MSSYYLNQHKTKISGSGLALIVVIHLLIFWLLLRANVISIPMLEPVLSVNLVTEQAPEVQPQPQIVPPPPKPVVPRPRPEPVQIAAPTPTPEPTAVAVEPEPAPPAPTPPATAPAAPQIVEPRFDADYLNNPKPVYPRISRRLGEQGKVVLRVHVLPNGLPDEVTIQTSSGVPRLDQSALETVRKWKFVPARQSGDAVAAWVIVPIAFNLKE